MILCAFIARSYTVCIAPFFFFFVVVYGMPYACMHVFNDWKRVLGVEPAWTKTRDAFASSWHISYFVNLWGQSPLWAALLFWFRLSTSWLERQSNVGNVFKLKLHSVGRFCSDRVQTWNTCCLHHGTRSCIISPPSLELCVDLNELINTCLELKL